jgi:hypothetical protein
MILQSLGDAPDKDSPRSIETKHAALLILAHLDRLSEHLAPAEFSSISDFGGQEKSTATLQEPLAIEVAPGTLSSLWSIAEYAIGALKQLQDRERDVHDKNCQEEFMISANMLILSLRLIKVHVYQISLASLELSAESEPGFASSCREMIFQLAGYSFSCTNTCLSEHVSALIQSEALNILAYGFEVFFPAVHEQAKYITSLLRRRPPHMQQRQDVRSGEGMALSPVENKLLQMLLMRLTLPRPVAALTEGIIDSSGAQEQKKETMIIDLLCILSKDCIDEATDRACHVLQGKSRPQMESITRIVHLMQTSLLSRTSALLQKIRKVSNSQQRQQRLAFLVASISKHATHMVS